MRILKLRTPRSVVDLAQTLSHYLDVGQDNTVVSSALELWILIAHNTILDATDAVEQCIKDKDALLAMYLPTDPFILSLIATSEDDIVNDIVTLLYDNNVRSIEKMINVNSMSMTLQVM